MPISWRRVSCKTANPEHTLNLIIKANVYCHLLVSRPEKHLVPSTIFQSQQLRFVSIYGLARTDYCCESLFISLSMSQSHFGVHSQSAVLRANAGLTWCYASITQGVTAIITFVLLNADGQKLSLSLNDIVINGTSRSCHLVNCEL